MIRSSKYITVRRYRYLVAASIVLFITSIAALYVTYVLAAGVFRLLLAVETGQKLQLFVQLVLCGAVAGVFAYTFLEYIKRQTPLRSWFNRNIVKEFYVSDERDDTRSWESYADLTPAFRVPPSTIYYGANIRQISVQIAQDLRSRVPSITAPRVPGYIRWPMLRTIMGSEGMLRHFRQAPPGQYETDDPDASVEAIASMWRRSILQPSEEAAFPRSSDADTPQLPLWLEEYIERRVDLFQMAATARWHGLLRTLSAVISAASLAVGAFGVARWTAVPVAALLGLVVGGPTAWFVRDVVRIIERKAKYG